MTAIDFRAILHAPTAEDHRQGDLVVTMTDPGNGLRSLLIKRLARPDGDGYYPGPSIIAAARAAIRDVCGVEDWRISARIEIEPVAMAWRGVRLTWPTGDGGAR